MVSDENTLRYRSQLKHAIVHDYSKVAGYGLGMVALHGGLALATCGIASVAFTATHGLVAVFHGMQRIEPLGVSCESYGREASERFAYQEFEINKNQLSPRRTAIKGFLRGAFQSVVEPAVVVTRGLLSASDLAVMGASNSSSYLKDFRNDLYMRDIKASPIKERYRDALLDRFDRFLHRCGAIDLSDSRVCDLYNGKGVETPVMHF